jgi:hypothetical protein
MTPEKPPVPKTIIDMASPVKTGSLNHGSAVTQPKSLLPPLARPARSNVATTLKAMRKLGTATR